MDKKLEILSNSKDQVWFLIFDCKRFACVWQVTLPVVLQMSFLLFNEKKRLV
jgi:hypothetical protein